MMATDVDANKIVKIRLYNLRCHLKLTQKDFAEKTGLTQTTISSIEVGGSGASTKTLIAISRTTGASLDWLLGLTGENSKPLYVNETVHISEPKVKNCGEDPDIRYVQETYPYIFQSLDYKVWKAGRNLQDAALGIKDSFATFGEALFN